MNTVDLIVSIIVGTSVLISVFRGIVRELMYLLGWVVAFLVSLTFGPTLGEWVLPEVLEDPTIRSIAGYVLSFLVTLILMAALAGWVSLIVHRVGLGLPDRFLGAVYGLLRGGLIALLLTLFAGLTRLPASEVWRESLAAPWLALAVLSLKPYLPRSFAERINYAAGFAVGVGAKLGKGSALASPLSPCFPA